MPKTFKIVQKWRNFDISGHTVYKIKFRIPLKQCYVSPSQVTYHELETFNGDSSSAVVHEPYFPLSNLQPGRNYSISIQAVANGIESVDRSIFQATSKHLGSRKCDQ